VLFTFILRPLCKRQDTFNNGHSTSEYPFHITVLPIALGKRKVFVGHVEFSNVQIRMKRMKEIPGKLISKIRRRDCVSKFLSLADHIELLKHDAIAQSLINPCADTREVVLLLADLKGSVHDLLDHYEKIVKFQKDYS
jgi:hypothetical protein